MIQKNGSSIWKTRWWKSFNQNSKKKRELKKNKNDLRDLWNNIKNIYIYITGVSEEKKESGRKLI